MGIETTSSVVGYRSGTAMTSRDRTESAAMPSMAHSSKNLEKSFNTKNNASILPNQEAPSNIDSVVVPVAIGRESFVSSQTVVSWRIG